MAEEERIRVVRKLVMVGPRSWVNRTLAGCLVSPERPLRLLNASITEVSRIKTTEELPSGEFEPGEDECC